MMQADNAPRGASNSKDSKSEGTNDKVSVAKIEVNAEGSAIEIKVEVKASDKPKIDKVVVTIEDEKKDAKNENKDRTWAKKKTRWRRDLAGR